MEGLRSGIDATDRGRDLTVPPLDKGLCCHDRVPLLDSVVAFDGGLGRDGSLVIGGGGRGREKSSRATADRPGPGDVDPERPSVRD
jgi:hypothetical protein